MTTEPQRFLITSIGRTATYWLAWSLNRHPDILCSHGDHYPPNIVSLNENGKAGLELSSAGKPIRSIYDIPEPETLGLDQEKMRRGQATFHEMAINDVLNAHLALGDCAAVGNVHGYTLGNFLGRYSEGQIKGEVTVLNLIRHPVDQILSFYRRHTFDGERSAAYKHSRFKMIEPNLELVLAAKDKFDIDMTNHENLMFLSTAIEVTQRQNDILYRNALHIPYEQLTSVEDVFADLLRIITHKANIEIKRSYLDEVFALGPMNYTSEQDTAANEAFEKLADWQKFVVRSLLSEDVIKRYSEYGYTLECVTS